MIAVAVESLIFCVYLLFLESWASLQICALPKNILSLSWGFSFHVLTLN